MKRPSAGHWRLAALTGEAARNLVAAWPVTLAVSLITSGTMFALAWTEYSTTSGILDYQRAFLAAGGNVLVAEDQNQLQVSQCSALVRHEEVEVSGALETGMAVDTNVAPGTLFQTATVTSGTLTVMSGGSKTASDLGDRVAVGNNTARELGLANGSWLGVNQHPTKRVVVVDVEARNPNATRWIFRTIPPSGRASSCWVEFSAWAAPYGEAMLGHWLGDSDSELAIEPLVSLNEFARDPQVELRERPQANSWVVVGMMLTTFVWVALWYRRSEFGLYRVLGTTRTQMLYMAQLETFLLVGLSGLAGHLWATFAFAFVGAVDLTIDQLAIAARTTASTLIITMVIGPSSLLLVSGGQRLSNMLKDR